MTEITIKNVINLQKPKYNAFFMIFGLVRQLKKLNTKLFAVKLKDKVF